ncbi:SCO4848 family membrane protein [Pimelobacter simplex]|uniref:SCO4848 family membrane protein n=1 Tax=Nocardioides simplex TaxID=2045 RepID=UPI00193264E5|nr:hypothetical protein [Pimelobacter simplex]
MKFERKHAILLLAVAAWNVFSFGNFAKNLYNAYDAGEDRATGYWVAHTVLIVVNFAIAGLLGSLGWKALRASKQQPKAWARPQVVGELEGLLGERGGVVGDPADPAPGDPGKTRRPGRKQRLLSAGSARIRRQLLPGQ